jgi:hypothetical protein
VQPAPVAGLHVQPGPVVGLVKWNGAGWSWRLPSGQSFWYDAVLGPAAWPRPWL